MLRSKIHIPTYGGLVSVNFFFFFYEFQLNHCQIFFVTYNLVLMSILNSLLCCIQVLFQIYFLISPLFCHRQQIHQFMHNSLICITPSYLCLHFFLLLFFFVSWIQHMVLAILIDWTLIRNVFFLVLILILNKVSSFHNEPHRY